MTINQCHAPSDLRSFAGEWKYSKPNTLPSTDIFLVHVSHFTWDGVRRNTQLRPTNTKSSHRPKKPSSPADPPIESSFHRSIGWSLTSVRRGCCSATPNGGSSSTASLSKSPGPRRPEQVLPWWALANRVIDISSVPTVRTKIIIFEKNRTRNP